MGTMLAIGGMTLKEILVPHPQSLSLSGHHTLLSFAPPYAPQAQKQWEKQA